jgi:hypothetical protein
MLGFNYNRIKIPLQSIRKQSPWLSTKRKTAQAPYCLSHRKDLGSGIFPPTAKQVHVIAGPSQQRTVYSGNIQLHRRVCFRFHAESGCLSVSSYVSFASEHVSVSLETSCRLLQEWSNSTPITKSSDTLGPKLWIYLITSEWAVERGVAVNRLTGRRYMLFSEETPVPFLDATIFFSDEPMVIYLLMVCEKRYLYSSRISPSCLD